MRHSRQFLRAEGTHFHVVTRVVGREFLLGDGEKAYLHKLMRRLEKFTGVQVLTYCLMDNHVHLLLRTDEIDAGGISDDELVARVRGLYSKTIARELESQLRHWRARGDERHVAWWRERFLSRLGNLSEFMKVLKNTFSRWFNKQHGRTGTLWEDRYKIVLVEESEAVLQKVAAYIDLNPVRAGLVADPKDYAWSGYGEACTGAVIARRGITRLTGTHVQRGWRDAAPAYRVVLFSEGLEETKGAKVEVVRNRRGEEIKRKAIATGAADKVFARKGELSLNELLRCRVRYFTDGAIIGSREFVDRKFHEWPKKLRGKRKTGARKMRGGTWGGLFALRDLRKDAVVLSKQDRNGP